VVAVAVAAAVAVAVVAPGLVAVAMRRSGSP